MQRNGFRPMLECLEGRLTPTGNVNVALSAGSLLFTGDNLANAVTVTQSGTNTYSVSSGDGTTLINGSPEAVTFQNVTRDLRFRMQNGNDSIRLGAGQSGETLSVRGDLIIEGGTGNNAIDLAAILTVGRNVRITNLAGSSRTDLRGPLTVAGSVTITNGNGANSTTITAAQSLTAPFRPSVVRGNITVTNGLGVASTVITDVNVGGDVTLRNAGSLTGTTTSVLGVVNSPTFAHVGDDVSVTTTIGRSDTRITDTNIGGDVTITGGRNASTTVNVGPALFDGPVDVGGTLEITTTGRATIALGNLTSSTTGGLTVGHDLNLSTGNTDDKLGLDGVQVTGITRVATNGGADVVSVDDSTFFHAIAITTGNGNDVVQFERQNTNSGGITDVRDRLNVDLGANDDSLLLGVAGDPGLQVQLHTSASFFGGIGTDFLDDANLLLSRFHVTFSGFELLGATSLSSTPR